MKSLESLCEDYILDLCDAALTGAILDSATADPILKKKILSLINSKNSDEISAMVKDGVISGNAGELVLCLVENYKDIGKLEQRITSLTQEKAVLDSLDDFAQLCNTLKSIGVMKNINIDFSIVDELKYYSSIVFKGYIKGIPSTVLSGGQYDNLMKKMGKSSKAIGFAVYLDVLERLGKKDNEYDYDFIVLKDESTDPALIIKNVEAISENGSNVIVLGKIPEDLRYRGIINLTSGTGEEQ